jgi:hypothetical protein
MENLISSLVFLFLIDVPITKIWNVNRQQKVKNE